jgi:hypothetical protein
VWAIWTFAGSNALLLEDPHLLRPGAAGGSRVGHDRPAGMRRRAGGGPVDLLDRRGHARCVGSTLDERGLDARALDAVLDLVDEDCGDRVLIAVEQDLREVVVRVDAGGQNHVETALVGHPLAERGIPGEEHRARLDDSLHAVSLDGFGVGHGGVPLSLLVIKVRELHSPGLVGGAKVLVDQRQTELLDADGAVDGLDSWHSDAPPPARGAAGKAIGGLAPLVGVRGAREAARRASRRVQAPHRER